MRVEDYLRFVAKLKGVSRNGLDEAVQKAARGCGLEGVMRRICGQLSKGYRQRVGLAAAIVHNPPVLILDEPTIGLDPRQIIEIRKLIRGLAKERTVVLSTHILPEVSQVCDKVVIINDGRVVLEERLDQIARGMSLEDVFLKAIAEEEAHGLVGEAELEEVEAGRSSEPTQ